jgi:hypothetical protein
MDTSFLIEISDEYAQKIVGGIGESYTSSSSPQAAIEAMTKAANNMSLISAAGAPGAPGAPGAMNVGKKFGDRLSDLGR